MTDPGPVTSEQKATLAEASARLQKLMRRARIARLNAWTIGVFGALTVLWGLASGGGGLLVGVALLAVAWNEMRGVRLFQAIDPEGARVLGWNQLIVAGVIVLYCAFAVAKARGTPDPTMRALEEAAGIAPDAIADLNVMFYAAVAVVVTVIQTLLARYHFRGRGAVLAFKRETPAWAVELLGATRPAG